MPPAVQMIRETMKTLQTMACAIAFAMPQCSRRAGCSAREPLRCDGSLTTDLPVGLRRTTNPTKTFRLPIGERSTRPSRRPPRKGWPRGPRRPRLVGSRQAPPPPRSRPLARTCAAAHGHMECTEAGHDPTARYRRRPDLASRVRQLFRRWRLRLRRPDSPQERAGLDPGPAADPEPGETAQARTAELLGSP